MSWWPFNSTPFDFTVQKITHEKNTGYDFAMIREFCARVQGTRNGPQMCLKSITKRLYHPDPKVVLQGIGLLDAVVNYCGNPFKLEIATHTFEKDYRALLKNSSNPEVHEKLKVVLAQWAQGDFENDNQLWLIPALFEQLKKEGVDFSTTVKKEPPVLYPTLQNTNDTARDQREDDMAKAIRISLEESSSSHSPNLRTIQQNNDLKEDRAVVPSIVNEPATKTASVLDATSQNPYDITSNQTEDDITKAMRLSLEESKSLQAPNLPRIQQEKEDLDQAIELSLKNQSFSLAKGNSSNEYASKFLPNLSSSKPTELLSHPSTYKSKMKHSDVNDNQIPDETGLSTESFNTTRHGLNAKVMYGFEAVEDNELTLKQGDLVMIIDDSNPNWWKGTNQQGNEGLFPANFVSTNMEDAVVLNEEEETNYHTESSTKFNVETQHSETKAETNDANKQYNTIDENSETKIDNVQSMLNEVDPVTFTSDPKGLKQFESEVTAMGPLVDAELQKVDKRHSELTRISTELIDALNLYHQLMNPVNIPASVEQAFIPNNGQFYATTQDNIRALPLNEYQRQYQNYTSIPMPQNVTEYVSARQNTENASNENQHWGPPPS